MNINKLAPWNWFKKEEEQEKEMLPVVKGDTTEYNHPIMQLHRELDRIMDGAFRGLGLPLSGFGRWAGMTSPVDWLKPTLDVGASEKEYSISVELPGVDKNDVHLELTGDTLRIKGEKKQESEEKEKNYYRVERSYGSFMRVLSLPEDADPDGIEASFKNGVMKIRVPRKAVPSAATRTIKVNG